LLLAKPNSNININISRGLNGCTQIFREKDHFVTSAVSFVTFVCALDFAVDLASSE